MNASLDAVVIAIGADGGGSCDKNAFLDAVVISIGGGGGCGKNTFLDAVVISIGGGGGCGKNAFLDVAAIGCGGGSLARVHNFLISTNNEIVPTRYAFIDAIENNGEFTSAENLYFINDYTGNYYNLAELAVRSDSGSQFMA